MLEKNTNNQMTIIGMVETELVHSHTKYEEPFYDFMVKVMRHSGDHDMIPVRVSGYLLDPKKEYKGRMIRVSGELRSKTYQKNGKKPELNICLFAMDVELDVEDDTKSNNVVELDGFICKETNPRTTPISGIDITDVFLAVNRRQKQSDYIPLITWARYAKVTAKLPVGTEIRIVGRLQSRYIPKKGRNGYEVSVSKLHIVERLEEQEDIVAINTENTEEK